jgi:hypothetical protein
VQFSGFKARIWFVEISLRPSSPSAFAKASADKEEERESTRHTFVRRCCYTTPRRNCFSSTALASRSTGNGERDRYCIHGFNMQPFSCIFNKRISLLFGRCRERMIQSFNPQPSYRCGRSGSGSAARISWGTISVFVLSGSLEAGSSMPSSKLEQQGQTPGWREEILPGGTGSPQQIHAWNSMDHKITRN